MKSISAIILAACEKGLDTSKYANSVPNLIGGASEAKVTRWRELKAIADIYNKENTGYARMSVVEHGTDIRVVCELLHN